MTDLTSDGLAVRVREEQPLHCSAKVVGKRYSLAEEISLLGLPNLALTKTHKHKTQKPRSQKRRIKIHTIAIAAKLFLICSRFRLSSGYASSRASTVVGIGGGVRHTQMRS